MLIGVVCAVLMLEYMKSTGDRPWQEELLSFAGLFCVMYLAIFAHMLIHEAGHLVFGLISGYKFNSFRISSFMWVKENERIKLKRLSIAGTGGQCLMIPPELQDGKMPFILYNIGGSLANIIVGAVLLGVYFIFAYAAYISTIILLFAVVGFMIAVMNGVPMRMGTVDNDGYNTLVMTKNVEAIGAFWVQMKVAEMSAKGVRLKDMPLEWFSVPSDEAMQNSILAAQGVFACNRFMDEHRFADADKLMVHMLAPECGLSGIYRNLIVCDRIYIELITEARASVINGMLNKAQRKFMQQMKSFPSVIRTEYVYALLYERNTEKARKIKQCFEKIARSYPYQSDVQSERELLETAESKLTQGE